MPDADALLAVISAICAGGPGGANHGRGWCCLKWWQLWPGPGVEVAASEETVLATLFTALTTGLISLATAFWLAAVICGLTSANHKRAKMATKATRPARALPIQLGRVGPAIWRHRHQPPAGESRPAALRRAQRRSCRCCRSAT